MRKRVFLLLLLIPSFIPTLKAKAQTADQLLINGESAEKQQDAKTALRLYKQAELTSPDNPKVLCRLAKLFCAFAWMEDPKQGAEHYLKTAIEYAQKAVTLNANDAMSQVSYAFCLQMKAKEENVMKRFEEYRRVKLHVDKARSLDPKNDASLAVLGIWHREVASEHWAVQLAAKAWLGWDFTASLKDSKKILAGLLGSHPASISLQFELAKTLIEKKEIPEAVRHLKAIESLPVADLADHVRKREAKQLLEQWK